ncbi:MAG: hypothetical protein KBS97_01765 [Firmicutes bacterium]|nr:hypothetical protein [Candidatus Fiminaster equi]
MNYVTFASSANFPPWAIVLILLAFFGLIVLAVILVKRKVKPLQIKKEEMTEEEAARAELDRILVPVDEETQKQMDEAAKHEAEDDK